VLTQDYRVRLENFQGPLDLLLFLIRRAEVDISTVSLAEIADQYLGFLERIERIDVDAAGEFLVTAATLIELKSRLVIPALTDRSSDDEAGAPSAASLLAEADSDNPAAELVRQLLQYKAYRDAADALDRRRDDWLSRYPAGRAGSDRLPPPVEDTSDLEELEIYDLIEAFGRIIETVQFDRLGEHRITSDDTPIELHCEDVIDRLRRDAGPGGTLTFRSIFSGRTRAEMVGLFIALLELVRQRRIRVLQERINDDIAMQLSDAPDEEGSAGGSIAVLTPGEFDPDQSL